MTSPLSKYNWRNFDDEAPRSEPAPKVEFRPMESEPIAESDFAPFMLCSSPAQAAAAYSAEELVLEFQKGRDEAQIRFDTERQAFQAKIESLCIENMALSQKIAESTKISERVAKGVLIQLLNSVSIGPLSIDPVAWTHAYQAIMLAAELKGPLTIKANPTQIEQIESVLRDSNDFPEAIFAADADIPVGEIHIGDGTSNWMATMDDLLKALSRLFIVDQATQP